MARRADRNYRQEQVSILNTQSDPNYRGKKPDLRMVAIVHASLNANRGKVAATSVRT